MLLATVAAPAGPFAITDAGVLGDPAVGHYYLIRARNRCGGYAGGAPRVGEFEFGLD